MKRAILAGVVSTIVFAAPIADALTLTPSQAPPGIYIRFLKYGGTAGVGACPATAATTVISEQNSGNRFAAWNPVQKFSFDIEQTLNIGSQSTGVGAGKVTFNPLSISMAPSSLDSTLTDMAESGTPFCEADLLVVGAQGATELFSMRLAAVKTVSFSGTASGQAPTTFTFEYGGLVVVNHSYTATGAAGKSTGRGWDRTRNVALTPSATDLGITTMMQ